MRVASWGQFWGQFGSLRWRPSGATQAIFSTRHEFTSDEAWAARALFVSCGVYLDIMPDDTMSFLSAAVSEEGALRTPRAKGAGCALFWV